MQRRDFLYSLAAVSATLGLARQGFSGQHSPGADLISPYEEVDWESWNFVHSMSHQHQGQTDASRDTFREMGYRHFAFSNYYPSEPTPLPMDYREKYPDIVFAPNAEQHSFTDAGLHFNGLGSQLASGYGKTLSAGECQSNPVVHRFENLSLFENDPAQGVYRLDITLEKVAGGDSSSPALLTIRGAHECAHRNQFEDRGPVVNKAFEPGAHSFYLRTTQSQLEMELAYDRSHMRVTRVRLMQGTNRPWREMFRAALDGEMIHDRQVGGLITPDGGGITLNHPTADISIYTPMLDFDPRVLGIEVWNQHHCFGTGRSHANLHYYTLWDDLLRTGRRCWGFFVKDHLTFQRGRNVLIVPPSTTQPASERDASALRAYRNGTFFGSVAALAVDEFGQPTAPYDYSEFRFSKITVRRDDQGMALALEIEVDGNNQEKRPNVQIRIVTDQGIAQIVDGSQTEFPLERDEAGRLVPSFLRIEAFAYPHTHLRGTPLTAEVMRSLNVHEISRLNDRVPEASTQVTDNDLEPVPVVDMIFSQPLMRL